MITQPFQLINNPDTINKLIRSIKAKNLKRLKILYLNIHKELLNLKNVEQFIILKF